MILSSRGCKNIGITLCLILYSSLYWARQTYSVIHHGCYQCLHYVNDHRVNFLASPKDGNFILSWAQSAPLFQPCSSWSHYNQPPEMSILLPAQISWDAPSHPVLDCYTGQLAQCPFFQYLVAVSLVFLMAPQCLCLRTWEFVVALQEDRTLTSVLDQLQAF